MTFNKYSSTWLLLVQIEARDGYRFNELIDFDGESENAEYTGAWANVIVKAETIAESIEIAPKGLAEKNFQTIYIDKSENLNSLIQNKEVDESVIAEVGWLLSTDFVFMISDRIFPYSIPPQSHLRETLRR